MSFPLAAAHVVFVLIAWPWADSRRQDHHEGSSKQHFLGGSAEDLPIAAETPDDGKLWNMPVCLKLADGQIRQYPRSCTPSPRTMIVAPSYSAFRGVADDREMILKSADRGAQRSGITAADGHIPVGERRIDGNRVLRLQRISLREMGCIDAEAFFFTERASEGGKPGIAGVYSGPQSVFRFCEGSARSLHEPFDFPVCVIFV